MLKRVFRRFRALLSSRHLFGNWLSVALKYLLIRYGLTSGYVVVKCNNMVHRLCPSLYRFVVNNYHNRNITDLHCAETITFRYMGIPFRVVPPCFAEFSYMGRWVRFFDPTPFLHDILFEVFYGWSYTELDVGGRVVVDVGAGIGDTAVLFLLRGAGRVVALEPYPRLFDLARINIRINGFEDRAELLNAAVACNDGHAYASEDLFGYTLFRPAQHGRLIRTVTLRTVIEGYNIADGVLKMDCEGCEYQVFRCTDVDDLRRAFRQILVEYHSGPEPIASLLKSAGYDVVLRPMKTNVSAEKIGYIIARL